MSVEKVNETIELKPTEAAVVFGEDGVQVYIPHFQEDEEVPFYVGIAAAVAMRSAKDREFGEQMIAWLHEQQSKDSDD